MMGIHFRCANAVDVDLLLSFMREFYAIDSCPLDENIARQALETLIEDPSLGRIWLIHKEAEVVGYVTVTFFYCMEFHGRNALIDELFLTAPYRDQGIGAKTLQFVFEESRYWGVHTLRLEVDRSNERAKALYQKMGFSFQPHDRRHLMARRIEQ